MGKIRLNPQRGTIFIDYVDFTGRRKRETIGPDTKEIRKQAQQILNQREAKAILGMRDVHPNETPRFSDFSKSWLERIAPQIDSVTLESYKGLVRRHLQPKFGSMRIGSISQEEIELFFAGISKGDDALAPRTINLLLSKLRQILRDGLKKKLILDNPAAEVKKVKVDKDKEKHLDIEQIHKLLEIAREPYRTIYLLAVYTGLRRGEILGLKRVDIDFDKRILRVQRQYGRVYDCENSKSRLCDRPPKSEHSRRMIDLSGNVINAISAHLERTGVVSLDGRVFTNRVGKPIQPEYLDRVFDRDRDRAKLPEELNFHSLRHTFASLLIAAGVHPKAIQAALGHSTIKMTMDVYGHLMPSAFDGVANKLDALLLRQQQGNKTQSHSPHRHNSLSHQAKAVPSENLYICGQKV